MPLKLGKNAATYDARDIKYADVRVESTLPATPYKQGFGYGEIFASGPPPGWGMLGNGPCDDGSITDNQWAAYEGAGDCAWAAPAHETMMLNKNAGRSVPKFTCLNILEQYSAYIASVNNGQGYNLQTGANDNGSDLRQVLTWRANTGIIDTTGVAHKIGIYVSIEPGNFQDLWEAMYLFDAVNIGINFPTSAMDQFNANKIWSVVPGSSIEGGHCITLLGHPRQTQWTAITWGKRQLITPGFLTKYMDEAYAYITPERYNAVTGESPQHYTDYDLSKYISLV